MSDIIVIGGGAAGLAASVAAARNGAVVTLLERLPSTGNKILSTGGGRCNFTNLNTDADSYYNCDKAFIKTVLDAFGPYDAIDFFEALGIYPSVKNGYVYPRSENASSVRNALVRRCESLKVKTHTNTPVKSIEGKDGGFLVSCDGYDYKADKVILTAGSRSGAEDSPCAYNIAAKLGHSVSRLSPALTGILFDDMICRAAPVRTRAKVALCRGNEIIAESEGELQLTSYGASGIPIMNLSRWAHENEGQYLTIDFVPELSEEDFDSMIFSGMPMTAFFPEKLAPLFDTMICEKHPKHYIVDIKGSDKKFNQSQVTRGGVSLSEINPATFESKIVPGLYIAGEMLDVDGKCGGNNLHFAWASGVLAGCAAAGSAYKRAFTETDVERWKALDTGGRRSFG